MRLPVYPLEQKQTVRAGKSFGCLREYAAGCRDGKSTLIHAPWPPSVKTTGTVCFDYVLGRYPFALGCYPPRNHVPGRNTNGSEL